MQIVAAETGR